MKWPPHWWLPDEYRNMDRGEILRRVGELNALA
jgi:hypothetical protein